MRHRKIQICANRSRTSAREIPNIRCHYDPYFPDEAVFLPREQIREFLDASRDLTEFDAWLDLHAKESFGFVVRNVYFEGVVDSTGKYYML